MTNTPSVNAEQIRLYHAIASAVGREQADKLFPHVGRFLAGLDSGVRGTGQLSEEHE